MHVERASATSRNGVTRLGFARSQANGDNWHGAAQRATAYCRQDTESYRGDNSWCGGDIQSLSVPRGAKARPRSVGPVSREHRSTDTTRQLRADPGNPAV